LCFLLAFHTSLHSRSTPPQSLGNTRDPHLPHHHTHTHAHTCTHTYSYTHTHTRTRPVVTPNPSLFAILALLKAERMSAKPSIQRKGRERREGSPHRVSEMKGLNALNLESASTAELTSASDLQRHMLGLSMVRRQHWREPLPKRSTQSATRQTPLTERVIAVQPKVEEKGFLSCMPCWPWSLCCRGRS
jgi:hypothetical protein